MNVDTTRTIERFTLTSPFGVRFWDVVSREFVRSGLAVTVYEVGNPRRPANAFPNHSGIWILRDLRLRDRTTQFFEFGDGTDAFWADWPAPVKQYDLTVGDEQRRFQPFHFVCGAPQRGFARCSCGVTHSPVDPSSPDDAVPVFPSGTRTAPAGIAVVRAQLEEWPLRSPAPGAAPQWAAWAYVEAWIDGRFAGASFADDQGRVTVMFPWPTPAGDLLSPPSPLRPALALVNQSWRVELRAFYAALPSATPPDLCDVLTQPRASLIGRLPDEPLQFVELAYGRELVVRSTDDRASPLTSSSSLFVTQGP